VDREGNLGFSPDTEDLHVTPMLATLHSSGQPMRRIITPPPGLEFHSVPPGLGLSLANPCVRGEAFNSCSESLPPVHDSNGKLYTPLPHLLGFTRGSFPPTQVLPIKSLPNLLTDEMLPMMASEDLDWYAAELTRKAQRLLQLAAMKRERCKQGHAISA